MSDEFFIQYANNLFKNDSKNLKLVIQDFIERQRRIKIGSFSKELDEVRLIFLVDTISAFSDCKDFDSALKIKNKIKSKAKPKMKIRGFIKRELVDSLDNLVNIAFEAVFYQRYGFCDGTWHENGSCIGYRSDQHDFGLGENYKTKCHECCQLFFRSMLLGFVKNDGFRQIVIKRGDNFGLIDETWFDENCPEASAVILKDSNNRHSFDFYLSREYECVEIKADCQKNKIAKFEHFAMTNLFDDRRSIYPLETRFNDFLISVVSYSLVEFLKKTNFKKLKICPFCDNFFIAGDIRRTRCNSKECNKAYQRHKKRKQRENDPVKYV